ncbi:hypothetical protein DPMN_168340 [Dreissena polymorpha]|uniref:Mab-21-like HhH/H2TH-like domain-containing protein n=1 Tax=Dreissena polymorpha TaxID=45954 RepID=A0A9D4IX51_DREPO|nr:hypothetical protein DPMN_168340 [Dreissena polymorpha]
MDNIPFIMERQIIKEISLKVCEVMEDIGVTEEMVNLRRYILLQNESRIPASLLNPVWNVAKCFLLSVGSRVEGSTTLEMNSDTDNIIVSPFLTIIVQGKKTDCAVLVVKDDMCYSQCRFLQVLHLYQEPELDFAKGLERRYMMGYIFRDNQDRILVLNKLDLLTSMCRIKAEVGNFEQHGPALRISCGKDHDLTFALYCPSLPDDCQVLFTRPKPGHWPKQQTITKAKQCGVFLIHPGNIGSSYNRQNSILTIKFTFEYSLLQWRMSTNMIERLLMFDLNIIQMRAYILTKIIRKEFLGPLVDNRLSTFHMKTSLLFTIEYCPENIWRNDNLVECVLCCLNTLRRFLKRRFCPHYTIASVNLFQIKLDVFEMSLLETEISAMIDSKVAFLYGLQLDKFGPRLWEKLSGIHSQLSTKEEKRSQVICEAFLSINRVRSIDIDRLAIQSRSEADNHLKLKLLIDLINAKNDSKYKNERIYQICDTLSKIASVEASRCIENNFEIADYVYENFRFSLKFKNISFYLKYASMLVCTQQYVKAESLLNEVYISPEMAEISPFISDLEKFGKRAIFTNSNLPSDIVMDCFFKIVTPVSFSREESHCLPKHLVCEMYRRDPAVNKADMDIEMWQDTTVVNALPFLFYLKYLSSRHTHSKQVSLKYIEVYLKNKFNGNCNFHSHIETTLNMLGHIYELEDKISAAWTTYVQSACYIPLNNAAWWHLFRLLGQQVYGTPRHNTVSLPK